MDPLGYITSWCFQPIWKTCSSNWIISPGRDENNKYLSCHHLDKYIHSRNFSMTMDSSPSFQSEMHEWIIHAWFSIVIWVFGGYTTYNTKNKCFYQKKNTQKCAQAPQVWFLAPSPHRIDMSNKISNFTPPEAWKLEDLINPDPY